VFNDARLLPMICPAVRAQLERECAARVSRRARNAKAAMSYITKNLVPGETLLFETRHHWVVLLGPLIFSFVLGIPGAALLADAVEEKNGRGVQELNSIGPEGLAAIGAVLLVIALIIFAYGLAKRNATEMAVTNRRVLIKTGMASRRTLDMVLGKVESVGVEETFLGRVLGYGSVVVRGTGGTPESFVMIAHPQQFRQSVQQQIGVA
jgi:uncharacterized membrane protein YdbT with pleckstrin-like domain